jgi:hypothetical protein
MDPKEIGCEELNWIHVAQDRYQWQVLGNTGVSSESSGSIKCFGIS